jgi:tetratricopeptide (TPR) repeat protein
MTPVELERRAAELFKAALDREPARWGEFLARECSGDEALRAAVETLLTAHAAASGFLEPCWEPAGDMPSSLSAGGLPPDSLAGYEVLKEIHRGGQGVVYEALQKSTRRKVALKVMKEGPFASAADQARFEREVQILAQLNHPSIVAIHDSGQAAGCHYFVMDYISGQSLDGWIGSGSHSIEETLRLFAKICNAVNAAHLRGITHRDLKPGNIRIDDSGEPHILDFGLAKVPHPAEEASMTLTGQFLGSLPWASPEQAEGVPAKIDLRTDVYSLGVILYQMLTGKFPYEVIGNMRDVLDRIMRAEPQRPSAIRRQINDEVETIALKCLHKERELRYQSAGELARDIQRYLDGEAIVARPPSVVYQLRVFARRHKALFGATAAVFGALLIGVVVSTSLYLRAQHQTAVARKVSQFTCDLLAAVAPGKAGFSSAREILDDAAKRIDSEFKDDPLEKAQIQLTLATTYLELGEYELGLRYAGQALRLRRAQLGEADRDTLHAMDTVAMLYRYLKRYDDARRLHTETLALRQQHLGNEDPDTLESMNNLAVLLRIQGQFEQAEKLHRATLELRQRVLGAEHRDTLMSMTNLAAVLWEKGDLDEALRLTREALDIRRRTLNAGHPDTLQSMNNLAKLLARLGELDEAERLYWEALPLARRTLGNGHRHVATLLHNLGELLCRKGQDAAAAPLLDEARRIRQNAFPDDEVALSIMSELGACLTRLEQFENAESVLFDAWARLANIEDKSKSQARVRVIGALAGLYDAWGRSDLAAQWHEQLVGLDDPVQPSGEE